MRLASLLAAVNRVSPLQLFDQTFFPKEYVRTCAEEFLFGFVQSLVLKGGAGAASAPGGAGTASSSVERPSVIHRGVVNCVAALQQAASYMDINVRDILWRALFVDDKLTAPLFKWYVDLVRIISPAASAGGGIGAGGSGGSAATGVVFSTVGRAFVLTTAAPRGVAVELWTNEYEMRALCSLIGGHGVCKLDRLLCELIGEEAARIKRFLAKNQTALRALAQDYMGAQWEQLARAAIADGPSSDTLLCACITMGNALQLRRLLHEVCAMGCCALCGVLRGDSSRRVVGCGLVLFAFAHLAFLAPPGQETVEHQSTHASFLVCLLPTERLSFLARVHHSTPPRHSC